MKRSKYYLVVAIILGLFIAPIAGFPLDLGNNASDSSVVEPEETGDGDVYVGSFSVLVYNTYLLNPEGPEGEAPDNDCRGYYIGRILRDLDYDIVALAETFDDKGRNGLWDQINSYCVKEGYSFDHPSGGYSHCKYPAWVLNWPSASDGACGRYCTETGGLSLLSKHPFIWNSSSTHTKHFKGDDMCGAVDCRAGKGFIRTEIKNIGGINGVNLQVYLTHTQANYHTDPCSRSSLRSCGRWYGERARQLVEIGKHSRTYVGEGDGPILYLGDFNIPARDFKKENIHRFFMVYEVGGETEYDNMISILNARDAYREVHPPPYDSLDRNTMLLSFTSNPSENHLAKGAWHGRIDYQFIDDSRSCYRLVPVSAEHIDLKYPHCNTGKGDSLSDHFAVGVIYDVYRKIGCDCKFVTDPPTLHQPVPQVFPWPYGSGMSLSWSELTNPGVEYYEIQYSKDGGATWHVYIKSRSADYGPWINHHGNLPCGDGYQHCLAGSQQYDYRVRALDSAQLPLTDWSNVASGTSIDWAELRTAESPVINPDFEAGLSYWESYGDGMAETVEGGLEGSYCASISRDGATGHYFGLVQRNIPCEPNTTYRLSLWVKTEADSGSAAAALGNWGSPNTHHDFGWTGAYTNWTQISGIWTSRWDETSMDIVLYGSTDFSGDAYFDHVVLEKVGLAPLEVAILGPSSLGYKKLGTYTAGVSQGSGAYRYQWHMHYDGNNEWERLGTQQTQSRSMLNRGFTLRVDVHDNVSGQEASVTKHVEYEEYIRDEKRVKLR